MQKSVRPHGSRWMLPLLFVLGGAVTVGLVQIAQKTFTASASSWLPIWHYVILGILSIVVITALIRRAQSRFLWEVVFTLAVFLGTWYVFLLLGLSVFISLMIALGFIVLHIALHLAIIHNIFFFLGCVGAGILFAGWFPPELLVLILVAFTVYDMVAGPPGGPIEHLAKRLVSFGLIPGFAFPNRVSGFIKDLDSIQKGGWVLLGTGDVILPLSLVASASRWGIASGVLVMLGMLLGSLFLIARKDLHPRAALPPLAAGAAVPFLILLFIRNFVI